MILHNLFVVLYNSLFSLYHMINVVSHSQNGEKFFEFSIIYNNVFIVKLKRVLAKKIQITYNNTKIGNYIEYNIHDSQIELI